MEAEVRRMEEEARKLEMAGFMQATGKVARERVSHLLGTSAIRPGSGVEREALDEPMQVPHTPYLTPMLHTVSDTYLTSRGGQMGKSPHHNRQYTMMVPYNSGKFHPRSNGQRNERRKGRLEVQHDLSDTYLTSI